MIKAIDCTDDLENLDYNEGQIILIDKPLGITSFDVVFRLKWILCKKFNQKKIKIGHAGTLDPLATGLLIIATGKFTKQLESIQGLSKKYDGTITLGVQTPCYDAELPPQTISPISKISFQNILYASEKLVGKIEQIPPIYSAVKLKGEAMYKKARRGEDVVLKPRPVEIYDCRVNNYRSGVFEFSMHCSKGTYVRSWANDVGNIMTCGAMLSSLRRTAIGNYKVTQALTLEQFKGLIRF